jgi:uncharacterized delta-60 repeat protein
MALTSMLWMLLLTVTSAQTPDSFNPNVTGGSVYSSVVLPDGKILIAGDFTTVGGVVRSRVARLFANGTLDPNFIANNVTGTVFAIALQSDGKIVLGGGFSMVGPATRSYVVRVHPDGALDSTFTDPEVNGEVYCVSVDPDGKIVIGGSFDWVGSTSRHRIARLEANGAVDTSFDPQANGAVYCMARQADGKLLIGGSFGGIGGNSRQGIARLNADGTLDAGFVPTFASAYDVYSLIAQPDGKIVIAGDFIIINGVARNRMARVNADGTLDTGFDPNVNGIVRTLALQANGRILLGGSFTSVGGVTRNRVARVNVDGTLDAGFNPNANSNVHCLAIQLDGKVVLAGGFSTVGGLSRSRICRVSNEAATNTLTVTGTTQIDWTRGGSAPEVENVGFDTWNGSAWVSQGMAARIAGGWRASGLSLPASTWVRARGWTVGGYYGSSAWQTMQITTYGVESRPDITVEQPLATSLTDAASVIDFGTRDWLTTSAPKTFTIRNNGTANLTGLAVSADGVFPADFSVGSLGASTLVPGGSTTFTVTFTPRGAGSRSAALHLTSNDADETTFDIALTGTGQHLDAAFNPGIDGGKVLSTMVQPDGKMVVGGDFVTAGGSLRNRIARLNADGTLDTSFDPNANGTVATMVTFPNGKMTIGGSFTNLGGATRTRVARLFADGSRENGDVNANNTVNCLAAQADDKTIVGGDFTTVFSTTLNRITRLTTAGFNDTPGFNPNASGSVRSVAIQADGKLVVCGGFSTIGGVTQARLARLSSAGALDTTFTPNPGSTFFNPLECVAVQADGKILVAGPFTTMNGVARNGFARLNSDGTLDTSFNPSPDGAITSIALQADGKILIGGAFTQINWVNRGYIARLHADGSLDTSFDPGTNAEVSSLVIQADGKILVGGNFTNAGGVARNYFVRLPNDAAATQTLSVTGTTQIDWMRGGSSPEVEQVTFETWNGTGWTSRGAATRIAGGWRRTGLSIAAGGWVRARGRTVGGRYNGSTGLVEQILNYGTAFPDVAVEQPTGTGLADGLSNTQFGPVAVNEPKVLTYTVRNTGGASLTGLSITKDGSEAVDFTVGSLGATTLATGASTTFTITFMPSDFGLRRAALHLASSDYDETPFDISLEGTGVSAQESWRNTHFGTTGNSGNAADGFDLDKDGLVNLIEYAFGLNPTLGNSAQLPQGQMVGNAYQITFATPVGVTGIVYEAEWTATMLPGDWTPIPDTGIAPQHAFSVPVSGNPNAFVRLKVTGQ